MIIRFETITPLIMAGADSKNIEIREQSIKGILRWWYRFYISSQVNSLSELKEKESQIFGSTDIASMIKIRVISKHLTNANAYLCMNDSRPKSYNVPKHYDRIKRQSFDSGGSFEISMDFHCLFNNVEEIIKSLWLLNSFGGLGARWRRGFGSVKLSIEGETKYGDWDFRIPDGELDDIAKFFILPLKNLIGVPISGCQFMSLGNIKIYLIKSKENFWHNWETAMNDMRDKFYRAFKKYIGKNELGSTRPRNASPLIIQIKKTVKDKYFGIILTLNKTEFYSLSNLENFLMELKTLEYKEVPYV